MDRRTFITGMTGGLLAAPLEELHHDARVRPTEESILAGTQATRQAPWRAGGDWSDRNFMMTTRWEEDPEGRRRRLLEDIADYLRGEFPDLEIEPPQLPERRIRVIRGSQLAHDVYFRWEFLDDHEDPIAFLKRWGLPRRMRDNGTTPVWVGTAGLS
jgi:hypothetical protein